MSRRTLGTTAQQNGRAPTSALPVAPQTPLPPQIADLRGGVHPNLLADGELTFVLYAPWKPYASLVGDFNQWNTLSHPLRTDGAGLWWTSIPHPGDSRYGYYVAVDNDSHVWVGDPYAQRVDWNGKGAWGRLVPNGRPFAWNDADWKTPPLRDLVIYELCVRDFGGRWENNRPHLGTFADLRGRVAYLKELGVNAVELMPIQAFPGESSWGYNPVFYFAPAHAYGSPEEFKRLVNALHEAGIAVLLDVAFNHAWGEHPWYRMYPQMYGGKGEPLPNYNPFFHHTPQAVNSWGGVDWDHFCERTTRHFQDVLRFWMREYHIDGFRFDWVCGVDFDHREPWNPGFNPYHGISALAWAARQEKPDALLIGEFWQLDGTHPEKTATKLVGETELDAVWHGEFHHSLDALLNQRWEWEKVDVARAIGGYRDAGFARSTQAIHYTCSHDEVRPEHEIHYYTSKWIERPPGMSTHELALSMAALGMVALFAATGVPMLYAGQEFGESGPRTVDFLPLNWSLLEDARNAAHYRLVQRLIAARRTHPALRSDHVEFVDADLQSTRLLVFRRWDGAGDHAVAALNFAPQPRRVRLTLPRTGQWYDVVADRRVRAATRQIEVELPPYGACLLTLRSASQGAVR